jgi:hypothetical protein
LPVKGDFGMLAACDKDPTTGLGASRESSASVGGMTVMVSAPHGELSTVKLFGDQAIADYQAMLAKLGGVEALTRDGRELRDSISDLLTLPSSTTERTSFTFAGKDGERVVLGACRSSTTVRTFGTFDDPSFSLSCRIASEGVTRELHVHAKGSWANAAFEGELVSAGERFVFASQNVTVMGAGGVRGFDLSAGGEQVAALSFWQTRKPETRDEYAPAAWIAPPTRSPGLADAFAATLALAYVYPWPRGCAAQDGGT